MRHRLLGVVLAQCGVACALASCGGGGNAPPNGASAGDATATASNGESASSRSTLNTSSSKTAKVQTTVTGTATVTSTRTSEEPAFEQRESGEKALAAAIATVRSEGYTPNDTSQYHASQTLRVLTAARTGSAGGDQRAFFFVDDRYIGTDSSTPSAALKIVSQGETTVTLGYGMYRPHDSLCCPSGGEAKVRFQLDNGRLQALDPIPPAHASSGLARL